MTHSTNWAQIVKGINVVGPFNSALNESSIQSIKQLNANWIALTPEASISRSDLSIHPTSNNQQWTHSPVGYINLIRAAKAKGVKIMLKPHLVLEQKVQSTDLVKKESSWRGDIQMHKEQYWTSLEKAYSQYILEYAKLADSLDVELFIIGTELKSFVKARPQFWNKLIIAVKNIYDGPISYSANWDNYQNIPFWRQLNLICVNGYFPISTSDETNIKESKSKWKQIEKYLTNISLKYGKKILISEFGYRNINGAGTQPWLHVSQTENAIPNNKVQANLFEAFFQSIWQSEVVIGGFVWNWQQAPSSNYNTDFTIQDKPAEEIISQQYSM